MFTIEGIKESFEFASFIDRINGKSKGETSKMIDCFFYVLSVLNEKTADNNQFHVSVCIYEDKVFDVNETIAPEGCSYLPTGEIDSVVFGISVKTKGTDIMVKIRSDNVEISTDEWKNGIPFGGSVFNVDVKKKKDIANAVLEYMKEFSYDF